MRGVRVAELLLGFSFLGPCACSNCESVCEDLASCRGTKDCEAACEETERISEAASCEDEFDTWVDCLSDVDDVCDETTRNGECVPADLYFEDCLDVYCVRTRDSSACACTDVSCTTNSPLPGNHLVREEGE